MSLKFNCLFSWSNPIKSWLVMFSSLHHFVPFTVQHHLKPLLSLNFPLRAWRHFSPSEVVAECQRSARSCCRARLWISGLDLTWGKDVCFLCSTCSWLPAGRIRQQRERHRWHGSCWGSVRPAALGKATKNQKHFSSLLKIYEENNLTPDSQNDWKNALTRCAFHVLQWCHQCCSNATKKLWF